MRVTVSEAATRIIQGGVAAIPTDTVYGLAALASNEDAIKEVFLRKNRPQTNPLVILIPSLDHLDRIIARPLEPDEQKLTDLYWPGPLTLILPVKDSVSRLITCGQTTVGVRIPGHPLALELLREVGPVVAPSANLSGNPSATNAEEVERDFGDGLAVLDGGQCQKGLESTIIGKQEGSWLVYRLGAVSLEELEHTLDSEVLLATDRSPSSRFAHYTPCCALTLKSTAPWSSDCSAIIGYEGRAYPKETAFYSLGDAADPSTIAKKLYSTLRRLDADGVKRAWVDDDLPSTGLYTTLLSRLRNAANPRQSS